MPPDYDIRLLNRVASARRTLIDWFVAEWEPWYGPEGDGDAARDIDACLLDDDSLPQCLVAMADDGTLAGTVSLREASIGSDAYPGPWLAALLVPVEFRGRGIGTSLIAAAEAEALRLGFRDVSVSTDTASGLLRARGWQRIGEATSLRGPVEVFSKSLAEGD